MSNKSNGYRDLNAQIDLATYRRIPWEDNIPFFLVHFYDQDDDKPLRVDPRSALAKVTDEAKAMGWDCMTGAEFEVRAGSRSQANAPVLPVRGDCSVGRGEALRQPDPSYAWKWVLSLSRVWLQLTSDHGYSLLRTTLNKDYFYDLYKVSAQMGVEIEGHRASNLLARTDSHRYGDWSWSLRDCPGVH